MAFQKITSAFLICILLFSMTSCALQKEDNSQNTAGTTTEKQTTVSANETVSVAIPEGYTLVRLSWLLEKNGICSSQDFIQAAQSFDLTKYDILSDLATRKDVCFKLEGYLFPATYQFKKNTPAEAVVEALVKTTASKLSNLLENGKSPAGYSLHDVLTIASIIEKEAFTSEQRTKISAVLHNRLQAKMKLQCDVTVKYCTGVIETQYPDQIDHYKYLYNTYRCEALPAGPICNPGMESIRAAIHPEDIDALYFVIATDPPYEARFSKDYKEHQKNCKALGY